MKNFKKFLFVATASISCSALANLGHSETLDKDGCWDGKHSFVEGGQDCMQVDSANWLNDDKLKVVYKNTCSHRIYAKFCNAKNNSSSDCGADGIMPHRSKSWVTYNASGSYSYMAVGSDRGQSDWVCASRVAGDNWYNMK